MADDTLSKLLQTSIEQHDRAVRWSWLLLAVLATFHLTTFERFVTTSHEMAQARQERAELAALAALATEAGGALDQGMKQLKQATGQEVEFTFNQLRSRFALLNLDVAEVRCRTLARHGRDFLSCVEPARDRAGRGPAQMQMQMQMQPPEEPPAGDSAPEALQVGGPLDLQILPAELAAEIAELPADNDLLVARLEPLIEAKLIEPAFARLNAFWRDRQLPALDTAADRSLAALERVAAQEGDAAAAARQSVAATRQVQAAAEAVRFAPPDQPRWWLTESGKGQASLWLVDLAENVADFGELIAISSIDDLLESLNRSQSAKAAVLDDLAAAMARLEADFEAQREQLGALLEPLKAVAVDLAFFCRHFGLIIALAGAAALVWPAEKLRVARLTAAMAAAAGQDATVWRWFEARRQGVPGAGPAGLRPYLLGGFLVAWSLYAAQRLTLLEPGAELWVETVLALAILLGASAWRWQVLRRLPTGQPL